VADKTILSGRRNCARGVSKPPASAQGPDVVRGMHKNEMLFDFIALLHEPRERSTALKVNISMVSPILNEIVGAGTLQLRCSSHQGRVLKKP